MQLLFDAAARWPDSAEVRRALTASLLDFPLASADEKERGVLLRLCREADVSMRFLSTPIIGLLRNSNAFATLEDCARRGADPFAGGDPAVTAYLQDPLLLAALPRILILNEALERVLTHVRRCILLRFDGPSMAQTVDAGVPADLVCALAGQCFFAGYHFYAADDEKQRAILLREGIEAKLREPSIDPARIERALSALAMYEYLDSVVGSERLLEQSDEDCPV